MQFLGSWNTRAISKRLVRCDRQCMLEFQAGADSPPFALANLRQISPSAVRFGGKGLVAGSVGATRRARHGNPIPCVYTCTPS